jgi:hypothetical protein
MSDPEDHPSLDPVTVRRVAATHGIVLSDDEAERALAQAWSQVTRMRDLATGLRADDDIHTFRRILEREAASG